uniref:Gustatory receptor n=1 Tax=Tetranychus urticae TaxID=32264 RepID=T1JU71_TETUR
MVDIEANSQNGQHEPISVFGRAFIRKNLSSQVIFWISLISMVARGFYILYHVFDPTISLYNSDVFKYQRITCQLYSISVGLILLHLKYNRSLYIDYLDVYQTLVSDNFGLASTGFVRKQNQIKRFFPIIAIIYEILTILIHQYSFDLPKLGFSLKLIAAFIIASIAQCGYVFSMQFIIECCIYSQSSLMSMNNLLDSLIHKRIEPSNNMNHIAMSIRLYYSKTVESIRLMDKFLTFAIFVFYFYFTGHCVLIVGEILDTDSSIYFILWLIFNLFGELSYLVLITYHLVSVNQNSARIFDKVYQISFSLNSSHSIQTMNEINLLLLRINRNDVGFTFAGLCMVSPSFISSLATISLTLGLALPSFIDDK